MKLNQILSEGVTLTKSVFDEIWDMEVDTLENGNPQPKHDLVKAMENAKKSGSSRNLGELSDSTVDYLKTALDNAIDINEDQGNKRLVTSLKQARNKL